MTIIVQAERDKCGKGIAEQAREMYTKVLDGSWSFLADLVTARMIVNRLVTRGPEMKYGLRERKISQHLICQRMLHTCNTRKTYDAFSSNVFPQSEKIGNGKKGKILRAFV